MVFRALSLFLSLCLLSRVCVLPNEWGAPHVHSFDQSDALKSKKFFFQICRAKKGK